MVELDTTWAHCQMCTGGFISAKQTGHSSSFLTQPMVTMMVTKCESKYLRSAGQSLASSLAVVGDFTFSINSSAWRSRSAASLHLLEFFSSWSPLVL